MVPAALRNLTQGNKRRSTDGDDAALPATPGKLDDAALAETNHEETPQEQWIRQQENRITFAKKSSLMDDIKAVRNAFNGNHVREYQS